MQPHVWGPPGMLRRQEGVTAQAALSSGGAHTALPGRARRPWEFGAGGAGEEEEEEQCRPPVASCAS